jgi:hypothetical protein
MAMSHREQMRAEEYQEIESADAESRVVDSNKEEDVTSSQLLALVLGETLNRSRVDATTLTQVLRNWRREFKSAPFDASLCQAMVTQVLHHKLGCDTESIPRQLLEEVGDVLWNDPYSKARLTRLWTALDQKA